MNIFAKGLGRLSPLHFTAAVSIVLILLYSAFVILIGLWDEHKRRELLDFQLLETARAYFNQVSVARFWNAKHGGVYAEIKDGLEPNRYLDMPERDITSTEGREYTLINPAYMTRILSGIANETGTYRFRLSSLNPVNPANRPDEWEARSLKAFDTGKAEVYSIHEIDGVEYFRYMAPLLVKEECLRCHGKAGYRIGDVRGGLGVDIPTSTYNIVHARLKRQAFLELVAISGFSVFVLGLVVWGLARRLWDSIQKEIANERLNTAAQLAGAAAHELRQPLTIVMSTAEIMAAKAGDGQPVADEKQVIKHQSRRARKTRNSRRR
jgi:two-component system NtrC family sensor kinase